MNLTCSADNLGLGGAVVINVYKRADGQKNGIVTDSEIAKVSGLGYNPAVIAKPIRPEDGERVRSKSSKSEIALGDTAVKLQSRL